MTLIHAILPNHIGNAPPSRVCTPFSILSYVLQVCVSPSDYLQENNAAFAIQPQPHCEKYFVLMIPTRAVEARYAKLDPEEEIRKAFWLFDDEGTGKV